MFSKVSTDFSIDAIREVFGRHRGAAAAVARELGVSSVAISLWLRGRVDSKRITAAMVARAAELLAAERAA